MTTHIFLPTVPEIAAIFEEECTALGAASVDCVQDEARLFARAVCGPTELVCAGDEIRGGVALRVDGPDVFVHPYTLRQICVNGAIAPAVIGTSRLERIATEEIVSAATFTGGLTNELRLAIRSCADSSHVSNAADEMRALAEMEAAIAIAMLMHLTLARHLPHEIALTILDRHASSDDASAYGLVNAVTSVAREEQDARVRWDLECIGGELVARAESFDANPRRAEVAAGV